MPSTQVNRVTLFKIAKSEDQQKLLAFYSNMKTKALKGGQPYIISCEAGQTFDDSRNQGFTIVAKTTFASMEDFEFYDKECTAHGELRKFALSVHEGVMMVYFRSVVD